VCNPIEGLKSMADFRLLVGIADTMFIRVNESFGTKRGK